jgi:hypothetical protein
LGIEVVKKGFVIFSVADFQLRYRLLDEDVTSISKEIQLFISSGAEITTLGKRGFSLGCKSETYFSFKLEKEMVE